MEIGSGYSTYLAAQAIETNKQLDTNYFCDLVAIEPNPNETLRTGFPGLSQLIQTPVQEIPMSKFSELEKNDMLFIDLVHDT